MQKEARPIRIILSGGGTGGSVRPLLAVAEAVHEIQPDWGFIFVGTSDGPEKEMVAELGWEIPFISLPSGKWRRYFSLANFIDIFKIIYSFYRSWLLLGRFPADLIVSAGSFTSVPLVWAAALKKIPSLIHQQDSRPGLANRLMAPGARAITVTFEKSLLDYGPKAIWSGNPLVMADVRRAQSVISETRQQYNLSSNRPVVLIIGGGTGAGAINQLIAGARHDLSKFCQLIHLTGRGKSPQGLDSSRDNLSSGAPSQAGNYQFFEFLHNFEVLKLMAVADLVVSRAGLGVLTELSALAKPTILIPMPHSHQDDNAVIFAKAQAAVVWHQPGLNSRILAQDLQAVVQDRALLEQLAQNISKVIKKGAAESMAAIIQEIVQKND